MLEKQQLVSFTTMLCYVCHSLEAIIHKKCDARSVKPLLISYECIFNVLSVVWLLFCSIMAGSRGDAGKREHSQPNRLNTLNVKVEFH